MKKYNAKYFLNKFDKIPENRWITGKFYDAEGRKCVLGHCGYKIKPYKMMLGTVPFFTMSSEEGRALEMLILCELFTKSTGSATFSIIDVNDGASEELLPLGHSPKERVMNILMLIEAGVKL